MIDLIRRVREEARRMASLLRSGTTAMDTWRGRPLEEYSEEELAAILEYLSRQCDVIEQQRAGTFNERPRMALELMR